MRCDTIHCTIILECCDAQPMSLMGSSTAASVSDGRGRFTPLSGHEGRRPGALFSDFGRSLGQCRVLRFAFGRTFAMAQYNGAGRVTFGKVA